MSISAALRQLVRERAQFACEYCGVTEHNVGSELTIDHYYPESLGGSDDAENLCYCCHRCNLNKLDYWPHEPDDLPIWNPRTSSPSDHILILADGMAYPVTAIGRTTIGQLRLNRPPLIAYRRAQQASREAYRLLHERRSLIAALEDVNQQQRMLIDRQRHLLLQQEQLIRVLPNESLHE